MQRKTLSQLAAGWEATPRMPVLFLGHGSPMNAIEENEFVAGFRSLGQAIEAPRAVLCISAHWETRGTQVTAMSQPRTIHDFGGFPKALFEVQYPAPGSPELAGEAQQLIKSAPVALDHQWGLDHGAWSVIKHMYPEANVPVVQMSLDYTKPPRYHYELARELAALRRKGVLIAGSGNMVHNLRRVAWDKLSTPGFAFDWALEASSRMREYILNGDHQPLIQYEAQGAAFREAIPTPEHYLPLLYALALQEEDEQPVLFNDKALGGSLTMTSVRIG
ncbi:4,5-DOPA-extradiol-dioxygenase [Phaeodactylibacter luteus]|nr:4,5-DOPA dioxygenase extradiol [Phaeodactylibacter luteus]